MKLKINHPSMDDTESELIDCITESTDPEINKIPFAYADKIARMKHWTLSIMPDEGFVLKLYKLWYDSVTLRLA